MEQLWWSADPAVFRHVLGHFASGVTVVTGMDGGEPVGLTCQAFASLSLDPPLVVLAPARTSTSWPRIEKTGRFCVNVLAEGDASTARRFAKSGGRKFAGVAWQRSHAGSPVLEGVLAYVDCALEALHEGGDHVLVVGRVLDLGAPAGTARGPLVFYRGRFGRFVPLEGPLGEEVEEDGGGEERADP